MHSAAPLSVFLPGPICSVHVNAAAVHFRQKQTILRCFWHAAETYRVAAGALSRKVTISSRTVITQSHRFFFFFFFQFSANLNHHNMCRQWTFPQTVDVFKTLHSLCCNVSLGSIFILWRRCARALTGFRFRSGKDYVLDNAYVTKIQLSR